jgi:hypothetical protein
MVAIPNPDLDLVLAHIGAVSGPGPGVALSPIGHWPGLTSGGRAREEEPINDLVSLGVRRLSGPSNCRPCYLWAPWIGCEGIYHRESIGSGRGLLKDSRLSRGRLSSCG